MRRMNKPLLRQPRWLLLAGLLALAGCGGGSGSSDAPAAGGAQANGSGSITSNINGTTYPLRFHVPPASAGAPHTLPVVYALDGESWFDTLVAISTNARNPFIVVAIGNAPQRSRDYVPANSCTSGGGGHEAFFQFIRTELIPLVERSVGGHPARRALLGHSHGGSFVVYALFAQAPGQHLFSAYLSSDASLSCMPTTVFGWEEAYAAAHGGNLPVRLHVSYATLGNFAANQNYVLHLQQRPYGNLALAAQAYSGTHSGIVPMAYSDAMAFAFVASGP